MATQAGTDARSSVQVLARALEILRLLGTFPAGLTQTEIGERLSLPRSTVSRLLMALEAEGFVVGVGARGRYRLGPELVRLASAARRHAWMELRPMLVELSAQVGETVDLSVLEGDRAVFVDQVVASNRLRAVSAVGDSFPLHASANGKAMLASMPGADRKRVLAARLDRLTPNTITTAAELRRELEVIDKDGVAYDREEQTEGVCAVGAVIGTVDHDLLAVSIPVPAQRFGEREQELHDTLLEFVDRVGEWLAVRG